MEIYPWIYIESSTLIEEIFPCNPNLHAKFWDKMAAPNNMVKGNHRGKGRVMKDGRTNGIEASPDFL